MYLELIGTILPNDFKEKEGIGNASFNPLSINSDRVTVISPSEDGNHALIFLSNGQVIMSDDPYNYVKGKFGDGIMVIRNRN